MKTAIVLGATGLVGKQVVNKLLDNYRYEQVKVFVRRSTNMSHPKLQEYIIDFDHPDTWAGMVKGDVLFSAFGTTLAKAGSKNAQYKIDYTYQYKLAAIAARNKVSTYVLVSAAGADPSSMIFYSCIKGELERDVSKLPFQTIHILRPGLLAGDREEKRMGEEIGYKIMKLFAYIPGLKKYRPVRDVEVARAMIHAAINTDAGVHRHTLEDIFDLAGKEA